MKKTYQIPAITVTKIVAEQMIAESHLSLSNDSEKSLSSGEILVKDRQQSNYDVWGDDWSK